MSLLDDQHDEVRSGNAKAESGGASIHIRDGRVSKALGWFWGMVGAGIAGAILLASNNLYQLNLTVARGIDSDAARDIQLHDHEQRLRSVEHDVDVINGKIFRGEVDEFGLTPTKPDPKAVSHGNR